MLMDLQPATHQQLTLDLDADMPENRIRSMHSRPISSTCSVLRARWAYGYGPANRVGAPPSGRCVVVSQAPSRQGHHPYKKSIHANIIGSNK